MKKRNFFKTAAIGCLCLMFLGNAGNLRCENAPDSFRNTKPQARMADKKLSKSGDGDQEYQNDKSEGFRILEWMIRQNLMKQYQKFVVNEDLEESLD